MYSDCDSTQATEDLMITHNLTQWLLSIKNVNTCSVHSQINDGILL